MMGLFFFVAGLLAEHALVRHGLRRYLGDRMLRLGLPWLVSALLVWPVSVWLAYVAAGWRVSPWWVFSHRDPQLDSGRSGSRSCCCCTPRHSSCGAACGHVHARVPRAR
jgi:hypothetical protein